MADELSRAHVIVCGRVQGVWYRSSTEQVALRLGLGGWVRNLPDGSVEAVFEGPRDSVQRAVAWAERGPEHAVVDSIDVSWESPLGERSFTVRYA